MPLTIGVAALEYVAGDDVELEFTVTDQDGVVANITGDTVRFGIAPLLRGQSILGTETSPATATYTLTNPSGGIFHVLIDGEDTADLLGVYRWQCELEDVSGGHQTILDGTITFTRQMV